MLFLTKGEAMAFFARIGVDRHGLVAGSRSAVRHKKFDVYYESRLRIASNVGLALAAGQGNFSTCMLWAHDLVSADRSHEPDPPPGWGEYRHWRLVSRFRSSQELATPSDANFGIKRDTSKLMILVRFLDLKFLPGTRDNCGRNFKSTALATRESRSLYEVPGHVFDRTESTALGKLIEWAILTGWDALIGAKPDRCVIHLSHDDRITIYARSTPARLIRTIEKLGLPVQRRGLT
jgi:hypothetical protein